MDICAGAGHQFSNCVAFSERNDRSYQILPLKNGVDQSDAHLVISIPSTPDQPLGDMIDSPLGSTAFNDDEDRIYMEDNFLDQQIMNEVDNMEENNESTQESVDPQPNEVNQDLIPSAFANSKPVKQVLYVRGGHRRAFASMKKRKHPTHGWMRRRL